MADINTAPDQPAATTSPQWMNVPTRWIAGVTAYLAGYLLLLSKYQDVVKSLNDSGVENRYAQASIIAFPLLIAALYAAGTAIRQRRTNRLAAQGITGQPSDPGYFRLRPYEADDSGRFDRADHAHEEVLKWVRRKPAPILYLSGRSGSGK